MNKLRIAVVADNEPLIKRIAYHLNLNADWEAISVSGVEDFLVKPRDEWHAIILCYDFKFLDSEDCLELLRENYPSIKTVHVVSQDNEADYRDYLSDEQILDVVKNDDVLLDTLWNHAGVIHRGQSYSNQISHLKKTSTEVQALEDFVCTSPEMILVRNLMNKASNSDINVTIFGDTGTGKEVVAKYIHHESRRWNNKMVAVNVSAIPTELIESAFFGHEKGSFTGAISRKIGYFEEASSGTLFLDEIGDMDIRMQAKLLRVLQEGEITRVGGVGSIKVDVRVISATHKDLKKEVEQGNFREDLYYRLLGLSIKLPPLKDRGEDIILMAERFIHDFCKKNKKPLKYLADCAKVALMSYTFAGNVRELKAVIELAIVMTDTQTIYAENLNIKSDFQRQDLLAIERTLEDYELIIIEHFLKKYDYKVRFVAKKLGIGKTKIYDLLQRGLLVMPKPKTEPQDELPDKDNF